MTPPIRMPADHVIYSFSPDHPPALEVEPGATVIVETRDAYDRRFQRRPDIDAYLRDSGRYPGNPATGPILIRDLRPGDGLDVTIEKIELADTGYVAVVPGIGVLGDTKIEPRLGQFHVRPDGLWYEDRLRLPLRPMVGTIGVAPAAGEVPTLELGYHGGNLDCNDVTEGTVLHFPVAVFGGLLAVGDVHANMGFGEVYSGVNIDATVTLRIDRAVDPGWPRPWFETDREVMTIGAEDRIEDAIRQATEAMTDLLQQRLGVSHPEALALTGAACDIRLGQASKFGVKVSAYAAFPKSAF